MSGQPLTVAQAWKAYDAFRRLPEVLLVDEPEDCESWLERWALEDAGDTGDTGQISTGAAPA
jgi:hypothetical protein